MEAARQDTRTTVLLICAAFDAQVLINAALTMTQGKYMAVLNSSP